MNHTITIERPIHSGGGAETVRHTMHRVADAMCRAWDKARMSPRARYLSQARDHIELEQRIRAWDECEACAASMFSRGQY